MCNSNRTYFLAHVTTHQYLYQTEQIQLEILKVILCLTFKHITNFSVFILVLYFIFLGSETLKLS